MDLLAVQLLCLEQKDRYLEEHKIFSHSGVPDPIPGPLKYYFNPYFNKYYYNYKQRIILINIFTIFIILNIITI